MDEETIVVKDYTNRNKLIVIALSVLIGGVVLYGGYVAYMMLRTTDSVPEVVVESPKPPEEGVYRDTPPLTLHLANDILDIDIKDVVEARTIEVDRQYYYTLLTNPDVTLDEVALAEPAPLPNVLEYKDASGQSVFDVLVPEGAPYETDSIPAALAYDEVTFNGVVIGSLFENKKDEPQYQTLEQIRQDVKIISEQMQAVYGTSMGTPSYRLHGSSATKVEQVGYAFPSRELIELFATEIFLATYVDSAYLDNTVELYAKRAILNQAYMYSDIAIAKEIARQYMSSAERNIVSKVITKETKNNSL